MSVWGEAEVRERESHIIYSEDLRTFSGQIITDQLGPSLSIPPSSEPTLVLYCDLGFCANVVFFLSELVWLWCGDLIITSKNHSNWCKM